MKWLVGLLACLAVAVPAQAGEAPPLTLVKRVTDDVLAVVRTDSGIRGGNASRAVALVQEKVLPHFDFPRMTALAVGRYWRQATPAQRAALTEQFQTLLVRTYSTALTQYRNQAIEYRPMRWQPADPEATVRTVIRQPGAQAIALDYSLEKVGADWKVYDIAVDGVSLVTNYRAEFAHEIGERGVDGLVARLQARNAGAAAAKTSAVSAGDSR